MGRKKNYQTIETDTMTEIETEYSEDFEDVSKSCNSENSDNEVQNETVISKSVQPSPIATTSNNLLKLIKPVPQAQRRSSRLKNKMKAKQSSNVNNSPKPNSEINPTNQGDSPGFYGIMKGAFQDMTNQIINAIQTAFSRHAAVNSTGTISRSENSNNTKIDKRIRRSRSSKSKKSRSSKLIRTNEISESSDSEYENETSDASSECSTDTDSINTSVIAQRRSKTGFSNTKLPSFTGKEKWEVWINRYEAVAALQNWNNTTK